MPPAAWWHEPEVLWKNPYAVTFPPDSKEHYIPRYNAILAAILAGKVIIRRPTMHSAAYPGPSVRLL